MSRIAEEGSPSTNNLKLHKFIPVPRFSTTPTALCVGCGCTILADQFEDLPSADCQTGEDEGEQTRRS